VGTRQPLATTEREEFVRGSHIPGVCETIGNSIAPSIYNADDIKKVVACLLFAGSRKWLVYLLVILVLLNFNY
jgi:DNA replicative helicase MCM subunit Mcm2 (Cdc46/Mcm family)